jgi:four helix bundle protein
VESYRDLVAWQKSMALATEVYGVSDDFPRREMYGLTRQLRDAAVSVPSNIAEGKGRSTTKDYLQFLYRARGSLYETQTQLEIARNLGFLTADGFAAIITRANEAGRILNGLIAKTAKRL